MAITRAAGSVSEIVNVYFRDTRNVSTFGMPNVSASSIAFSWIRNNQATQSSGTCSSNTVLGTYSTNALTQISSTSTLGWYQFGIDNGALVSGGSSVLHLWSRTSTAGVGSYSVEIDLLGNTRPVSVSTMTTPVGVSSASVNLGVSTVAVLVGVSTLSVPVGVSSATVNLGVSTLAASVSSVTGSVNVSSIPVLVGASTIRADVSSVTGAVNVSSATVNLGVSTLATSVSSVTGSVNISSYSRQVGVSSASVDFGVSTIAPAQKLVGVSTFATQVGVSSASVNLGVSTNTDKTGYSLTQAFPTNFSATAITATGAVGMDWGNIENPATVQTLIGTSVGSVATEVSSNITKVNGVTVNGNGQPATPWGP